MNIESPMVLIGIGTAGCAMAHGVCRAFGEDIRCLLADTDASTGGSGEPFVLLGGDRLSGRGAGGDIVAGRLAAEGSVKALDEHIEGVRLAVIVTALGGGTGGGATLEAAKHLGDLGIPSVVFATTPFAFEGADRQRNARGMTTMIEDAANATFFLPLDRLVGDTDNMAVNSRKLTKPASAADFDMTAMPMIDVEFDTVSAAVTGLNKPRMATSTMPM